MGVQIITVIFENDLTLVQLNVWIIVIGIPYWLHLMGLPKFSCTIYANSVAVTTTSSTETCEARLPGTGQPDIKVPDASHHLALRKKHWATGGVRSGAGEVDSDLSGSY